MFAFPLLLLLAAAPTHLSDLLQEARQKNPDIQAAQARATAAQASVDPAGAFDDPMLMVQLWNAPVDFSSVPLMVQLSQPIPLGGKRAAKRDSAVSEMKAAAANANAQVRDVQSVVAKAYFDLYQAERTQEVDAAIQRTTQVLLKTALSRVQTGTGQQAEVLRLQGALIQLESELEIARQQAASVRARLAASLDRDSPDSFGPTTDPAVLAALPPEADLRGRALKNRPELIASQQMVSGAEAQVRLARAEKIPDLNVFVAEMHSFGTRGLSDFLFAGFQVNLPIFEGTKNEPRVAAANAQAEALRAAQRSLRNRILSEVSEAFAQVKSEGRAVELHHELIPLARQSLESAEATYAAGRSDFNMVLGSLKELQMHELDLSMHLAAYEQHLADLEHAVGLDLGLVAASEAGNENVHH